jgi:hypothetical protein
MKKIVCNVAFALVALAVLAPNAWCYTVHSDTPDAASTSALVGIAGMGLVAVRKFLR